MSDDWLGDPFADPDDPAAREREERRREREEKRRKRAEKKGGGAPATAVPPPPEPAPPPATEEPPPPSPPPPKDPPPPAPGAEPPLPPPRAGEPEFWDDPGDGYHDEGDPEMAGAARTGRRSGDGDGGGRNVLAALARHPFRIAALVALVVFVWFLSSLFQPFHGDGTGRVAVAIPKGASVSEVGDVLDDKGVVDSSTLFQIRVRLAGRQADLYPGRYTLAAGMSYGDAIDALTTPPVKRAVTVTIPEGYTRSQAAQLVEEDGVPGSYAKATVRSKYLDPARYGGKGAKDLEGFLFPDTFELKPKAPVGDLVQLQLQDFKRRIGKVDMRYAKSKNLTIFDVLTIASMVEREAGVPGQRKLVASVIYNRLHEGMPLGIDATIRFATGNYTRPLTESELAIDSPYNSRTNVGLPPGPINSPGLEAIEAAAHPAKTDYLFYVTTPGACGKLTFAKTEAEFEAAVRRYESAREAAGGNSPDSCGE
ncbi:MAG TPA: endolytic transglycosylase MltG [Solirubrobacterales bacterium]|nr:endolytic transglycosylase MltG [Solirubrobacterales bacterium]